MESGEDSNEPPSFFSNEKLRREKKDEIALDLVKIQEDLAKNAEMLSQAFGLGSFLPYKENRCASVELALPSAESISLEPIEIENQAKKRSCLTLEAFFSCYPSSQTSIFHEQEQGSSTTSGSGSPKKKNQKIEEVFFGEKTSDFLMENENSDSRQLRIIKEHNETLPGSEKSQWAKKFLKLCERIEHFLEKLAIPDDSGVKSESFKLLYPLTPVIAEVFHSKGFDPVLVGIIAFACKFKKYPLTAREVVGRIGLKEKPVNKAIKKLNELYPQEASSEISPRPFISRIISRLGLSTQSEEELTSLATGYFENLEKIRVLVHEHALTIATFCVYLACLAKGNEFVDVKRMADSAGVSRPTLVNIYKKYFPFQKALLAGVGSGTLLSLKELDK